MAFDPDLIGAHTAAIAACDLAFYSYRQLTEANLLAELRDAALTVWGEAVARELTLREQIDGARSIAGLAAITVDPLAVPLI